MSGAADIPVSRVEWKGAVRIIRSAFPPIDLFEDIADPADWPLLISAEQKTNPRIMATIGNLDLVPVDRRVGGNGASYLMAPFTHISTDRPSRFRATRCARMATIFWSGFVSWARSVARLSGKPMPMMSVLIIARAGAAMRSSGFPHRRGTGRLPRWTSYTAGPQSKAWSNAPHLPTGRCGEDHTGAVALPLPVATKPTSALPAGPMSALSIWPTTRPFGTSDCVA